MTSFRHHSQGPCISALAYRGFTIAARTFEVRGTGRWAIGVIIGRWGSLRAFDSEATAPSEEGANAMCRAFGRRIIDQSPNVSSLADLVGERREARPPSKS